MTTVTVETVRLIGGRRTIWIIADNGDFGFSVCIEDADKISDARMQAIIDGDVSAEKFVDSSLRYDAKGDRLAFSVVGPYRADSSTTTIARALIASKLATALGLRQPTNLGAKPAKR